MIGPQKTYHQLARRVIVPVVGLAALFLVGLLVAISIVASYQTVTAQGEQAMLARNALIERGEYVRKVVLDYGLWDDAFKNLVLAQNTEWADTNIGLWSFQHYGFDIALVLAPDGRITYETVRGAHLGRAFDTSLTQGIDTLLRAAREGDGNQAVSGIVMSERGPAIVGVAAVLPPEFGRSNPKTRHLLVFVDILDTATLAEFGRMYRLPDLHLEAPDHAAPASVPVDSVDGARLAILAWTGDSPGDALLRVAVPAWGAVALAFAVMIGVAGRQARTSANLLAASEHRASHDPLTDLPNRLRLFERLDAASGALGQGGPAFAVAYLDLDGFKDINDIHGHEAGDEVLRVLAKGLRKLLSERDVLARVGGDEFVLILPLDARGPEELRQRLKAMVETIEKPIVLRDGREVEISATIGVSLAPGDSTDPLALLRLADEALYAGKRDGKRRATFHAGPVLDLAGAA